MSAILFPDNTQIPPLSAAFKVCSQLTDYSFMAKCGMFPHYFKTIEADKRSELDC